MAEENKKEELVKKWYKNPESGYLKGNWNLTYDQMNYLMSTMINQKKKI